MSDEKKDVLERLGGWGLDGLKARVAAGREAADNGIWGMSINSARGEDANRISAAYSALWANAPTLFAIIDELAAEVRELRARPVEVEEVGGVKIYASGRLARELKAAKEEIERLTKAFVESQENGAKAAIETREWKGLTELWKRECQREREITAGLTERLDAIKKAVADE